MTSKQSKKTRDAKYAAIAARKEWSIIDDAREALLSFAEARGVSIRQIEYVASFEDWDNGMGVWIFFPRDSDLSTYRHKGITDNLQKAYLNILAQLDYPFEKFPNITFIFDSDENVQRNFEGSYFYRLK
jgi:hypothetical protein